MWGSSDGLVRFTCSIDARTTVGCDDFARCICDGTHAAVIRVATAIENDFADSGRLGALTNQLPGGLRRRHRGAVLKALLAEGLLLRRKGRQGLALHIVDHLQVQMAVGSEHGEPRTLRGSANASPNALPHRLSSNFLFLATIVQHFGYAPTPPDLPTFFLTISSA